MRDTQNEAKVEANLRFETNKALGATEQKNKELTARLIVEERKQKSVEAGLKNA